MKILFILPYPLEEASTRQRVYQFMPYLTSRGCQCDVSCFVDSYFHRFVYKPGRRFKKFTHTLRGTGTRIRDLHRASEYDSIFIHREAFPFGTTYFEGRFADKRKVIYDFDDAIFMMNPTHPSLVPFMRRPQKVASIIRMSSSIIAGNRFLADYAMRLNRNVHILPTCIDTDRYTPASATAAMKGTLTIGWIGQRGTLPYLKMIQSSLINLSKKYDFVLKIIADGKIDLGIRTVFKEWTLKDELDELRSIDIGIMPLPDETWTRSKCGYKLIQYMGVGKPVIASPVGVNCDIVRDGINGYLANAPEEWENKLAVLMGNAEMRRFFGQAGRELVVKQYSLETNAPKFYKIISEDAKPDM